MIFICRSNSHHSRSAIRDWCFVSCVFTELSDQHLQTAECRLLSPADCHLVFPKNQLWVGLNLVNIIYDIEPRIEERETISTCISSRKKKKKLRLDDSQRAATNTFFIFIDTNFNFKKCSTRPTGDCLYWCD